MEFDIVSAETLMDPPGDGNVARCLERAVTEHPDELAPYEHPRPVETRDDLSETGSGKIRESAPREAVLEERGIEP